MVQGAEPEVQDRTLVRSEELVRLFDKVVVNATQTRESPAVQSGPFRRFALYLQIDSAGVDDHTLQVVIEYLNPHTGLWHRYLQGIFASLFYEDTVTASEVNEVFDGLVMGKAMRVTLLGTSTTASLTFTVSVGVEFFN